MVSTTDPRAATPPTNTELPRGHRGTTRILRRKARRDLGRQKVQFSAVIITIVLGVMLFAASYDSFRNLSASYHQTYDNLAFADLTISGGDQSAISSDAAATKGVSAVSTRTQADIPFLVNGKSKLIGRVVGMPTNAQPAVDKVDVLNGSYLDPSKPDGVLVETHMASNFGLKVGDTLQIQLASGPTEVTMLGEVASAEYLFPSASRQELITTPDDFGVLFVPEALAAQAPSTSQVPQTLVLYDSGTNATSLDDELGTKATAAGATDVMTQEEQPSNAALSEDLQGFSEMSLLFPMLFLTGAGMATFIILNRIVAGQRAQIGTLAANGLARSQILRHYLSYGLVFGLLGALIGVAIGVPLGGIITGAYTSALSIPDTVTQLYWVTPLAGLAFGLVMGMLAAWAPARLAVRISPAEAMRGEAPTPSARASLIERLVPPISRLPVRWRMSIRGLGRAKRRSASTVLGVTLAIVLILASWGMVDTTQLLISYQYDDIQHDDAQVYLSRTVTTETLDQLSTVDGVSDTEAVLTLQSSVSPTSSAESGSAASGQYATQLQGFESDTKMHTFYDDSGKVIPLPDSGVLVGKAVKDLLGVEVGDTLKLSFASLGTSIDAKIVNFVDEPLGTFAYMRSDTLTSALEAASPAVAATEIQSPTITSAMVIYDSGADPDTVKAAISSDSDVFAVVTTNAIETMIDQTLALFYAFVGIMLVFGAIMAFALIFNTISVNISERAGELATMRANGISAAQVNRLMTVENLILTVVGIPIGLVAGYWMASVFMSSFNSDLFQFNLRMRPTTYVFTALAILAVALISQVPGLRAIRRLDIATVVRERSQ